jgi:hypothetical protein
MAEIKIKIPPTKISTLEEIVDRERNKAWLPGKTWLPMDPVTPLKDNPKAQAHYRRLIEAGIEDAEDFPDIDMSKMRKTKKSKKIKTKRKTKKKDCGCK